MISVLYLLISLMTAPTPQAGMCLGTGAAPEPASAAWGIDYMTRLVTAVDSIHNATRVAYQLPLLSPSEVSLVTDEAICTQAANAYAQNALDTPITPVAVYVIRVGSTRYLVWNPDVKGGHYVAMVIFSDTFSVVAAFTG